MPATLVAGKDSGCDGWCGTFENGRLGRSEQDCSLRGAEPFGSVALLSVALFGSGSARKVEREPQLGHKGVFVPARAERHHPHMNRTKHVAVRELVGLSLPERESSVHRQFEPGAVPPAHMVCRLFQAGESKPGISQRHELWQPEEFVA
eukprot:scaffold1470_cov118-Isochrysis_galbana.AAC.2